MMSKIFQKSNEVLNKKQKPQHKSICLKLTTMNPKKPNSANRRIAKVNTIELGHKISIKIPGEGHQLQHHSIILVKGAKVKDLIGVQYTAVRGSYDLLGVVGRKTSKSIYGITKNT